MKTLWKLTGKLALTGVLFGFAGLVQCDSNILFDPYDQPGSAGDLRFDPNSDLGASGGGLTVTAVSPKLVANSTSTQLTISGANFRAGATVVVGGVSCTQVTVQSPSQLTCSFPGKPLTCGGQLVAVTNADQTTGSLAPAQGLMLLSGTVTFSGRTVAVGVRPTSIAVADFNNDKRLDLAVSNGSDNSLSVFYGDGQGNFVAAPAVTIGANPSSVAAGDVNGDGKPDLVVANNGSNNVSVLLNNGTGGFSSSLSVPVGTGPATVVLADVNADTKLDLMTTNFSGGTVGVLLGTGAGGFASFRGFTAGSTPFGLAVGDVNGN